MNGQLDGQHHSIGLYCFTIWPKIDQAKSGFESIQLRYCNQNKNKPEWIMFTSSLLGLNIL